MELADKVIVVTGASNGIGLAIAHALVAERAQVVFAARSLPKLQAEAARATAAGGRALAIELDVTRDASVARAIAAVLARFGRVDVLINDAGNGGTLGLWSASDADTTRRMFDVHLLGSERTMRAVVPAMRAQGGGVIVNFASTVAWVPMPGAAAYSSAKAAVVALSHALRAELARDGIDVRVFAPPHTSTDAGKAWPLPLPKIFAPEWVADQLVRALRGPQPRVVPGGNGMLLLLQRLSPRLAAHIMDGIGWKALTECERGLPRPRGTRADSPR
jgi:NAD(P)-dependent dehydrogenase (short-subunit alcohol dehydrogenase family)